MFRLLILLGAFFTGCNAWATINAYPFQDPAQEQLFNELINELRCPKCQNQTISDSDAPLAKDLKDKTYKMIQAGADKQEVIDFMVDRYGHFVHYQPPVQSSTWILWFGPFIFLAIALLAVAGWVRKQKIQQQDEMKLSPEEQARLTELMDKDDSLS